MYPFPTTHRRWILVTAATSALVTTANALAVKVVIPRLLQPAKLDTNLSRLTPRRSSCVLMSSSDSAAAVAEVKLALEPIISDLQTRIGNAPEGLKDDEDYRLLTDEERSFSSLLFKVDGDGNLVDGDPEKEVQLTQVLSTDTMVRVRIDCPRTVASLSKLRSAADALLGEASTVDEKLANFGPMRDHGGGVTTGYAGGGDYAPNQFLETRGHGPGTLLPEMDTDITLRIIEARQALARISCGVLRAVARQTLPEIDANGFLELIDGGDGEGGGGSSAISPPSGELLSSSPLRLCRYAGPQGGVAFGAHTDATFLTTIPCASTPGLEILRPASGRWWRPEAAPSCRPWTDVMLLAGELLQALGRGRYRASVHRVVCPAGTLLYQPRVSTPLLLRGAMESTVPDSLLPPWLKQKPRPNTTRGDRSGRKVTIATLSAGLHLCGGAASPPGEEESAAGIVATSSGDDFLSRGSPLAIARNLAGRDDEIRRAFGPFAPGGMTILSSDPLLVRLHGFASRAECDAIMAGVIAAPSSSASGDLEESTTWLSTDAQRDKSDGLRRSSTCWIADGALPHLTELTERVSGLSGLPSRFMEKWQVARYKPQGYFKLHTDHVEAFNGLCCGGRLGTLILYLNDAFVGGQTDFPMLGVSVDPTAGDAIYFHNVKVPLEPGDAGEMVVEERSAHSGLCVKEGDKWIATKWLHPLPYPDGALG